jgi:gliding motility-associated-like protein
LIASGEVCQGVPTELLASPLTATGNTTYTLLGGRDVIAEGRDPNFTVSLNRDSSFTLIARSENGACEERQTVDLRVIPGRLEIDQDTVFTCLSAGSVTLSVNSSASGNAISWSPVSFNQTAPRGSTYTVRPTADVTYYATATINGCERVDSVAVRLDSLPENLSMRLDPEKDRYCQGDTITVRSPTYEPGDFPLITHNWFEAPGITSPADGYNGIFTAEESTTYRRETRNGACVDTSSIAVVVIEPPVLIVDPVDPLLCNGAPMTLSARTEPADLEGTFTWILPDGEEVEEASIDVAGTPGAVYQVTFQDENNCVQPGASTTLRLRGDLAAVTIQAVLADGTVLPDGATVAGGTVVTLRASTPVQDVNFNYNWSGNFSPSSGSGPEIDVTVPVADGQTPALDYSVTANTQDGICTFPGSIRLQVQQVRIESPDFFTPNDDGRNDGFRLFFEELPADYTLLIFNRWGQNIFTTDDPLQAWDGSKDGTPQEADVYLYRANFRQNGAEVERKGQFTLIR